VTLIKQSLAIDAVFTLDQVGQFEIISDGQRIAERGGNLHVSKIATKKTPREQRVGFCASSVLVTTRAGTACMLRVAVLRLHRVIVSIEFHQVGIKENVGACEQ
jgi:hypothetical protein